ncbi:MAG: response regulator [Lachnospiraceae bacterium]|nr:response regulator [Lachnospiraceae bacterium]
MKKADKKNLLLSYIKGAKAVFFTAVTLVFAFWIIGSFISPDEREDIKTDCREFEAEWQQVVENGEKIPVEVPGKLPAEYGEVITLTTILPEDVYTGECLCFRPVWQDVTIYIDGQLRLDYSTEESRPFGINSTMRYLFLELREEDAGKEMTYRFSSNSKYAGDMGTSYIGDRSSIWFYMLGKSGIQTAVSIILLLLSLFCIAVCAILKGLYKKDLSLKYLAWTIFFCALWMVSENDFRQMVFKNISMLSTITYWSLMLIPFPLILYIDDVQGGRYRKLYFVSMAYSTIMLIVGTVLQVCEILQFVQQVPLIHVGILIPLVCMIATITKDLITKNISQYLFVGIGIYGLLFTAILEMVLYYHSSPLSLGTVLAVGLLFLFLMAVIKTGQDLFKSEQNKREAIMAREAQTKFLANMSHEIRTPINAIIGMNEMILRENEDADIRNYAKDIRSASNMLLGLVNDVLDFTKIESGRLELVEDTYHLGKLLRDELLLLNTRTTGKPISTIIDIDPQLPSELWGDELRIKQILANVLSNAVKYTHEGYITFKVTFEQQDADNVMLCFAVTDTGIGIKQEDLSKIFDSFKRLELDKNRNVQGTGLGLNIAKQLVDLMQGSIEVESEYEKGSTFTVYLPQRVIDKQPVGDLHTVLREPESEQQESASVFTAPGATVLVVDDNFMNLSLVKGLLKRTKMQIDTAISGKKCLELAKNKKYDVIFMDHMMPEMDGIETLRALRAEEYSLNHDTVVIALTANAIAGCREMYIEYGFNDYLSKPILADKLEELLVRYLQEKAVWNTAEDKAAEKYIKEEVKAEVNEEETDLLFINRKEGLAYCMDSQEFYTEILAEVNKQIHIYLPQLEECFRNRDWKQYTIIVHALKSNTKNIGATNFAELSLQHQLAGEEENISYIEKEYAGYMEKLRQLADKIEEMI